LPDADSLNAANPSVPPPTPPQPTRHAQATRSDIVISLLLPPVGLVFGLVALARKESRRAVTAIVLSVISAVAMWATLYAMGIKDHYGRHVSLAISAAFVNNSTPIAVTRTISLDGAEYGPGLMFTYVYTLLDTSDTAANQTSLDLNFVQRMRRDVCTSGQHAAWLRDGVTVRYQYRDGAGQKVGSMDINTATCPDAPGASAPAAPVGNNTGDKAGDKAGG
jgi:hypothetical protein